MRAGAGPREAALAILRAVRTGSTFDQALERSVSGLDSRDRRLAHEISAGVLRERTLLDRSISDALKHPSRRLAADIHDVLRIGAYQLHHLDRVPRYAIVNSAVDLAKSHDPRAAALVNAVLRRLSKASSSTVEPAASPVEHDLASRFSHPAWLVDRWTAQFGTDRTERLLASNNRRPPLTIQAARWPTDRVLHALRDAGVQADPLPEDRGIVLAGIRTIADARGFEEGAFIVQDAAQKRLLDFAGIPTGVTVWDACAAPGGKAALLGQRRRVIATDRSRRRIERLLQTVRRASPSVTVLPADAASPPWRPGAFAWVMIDAPCSGTGAIARHPDARWRLTPEAIAKAAARQRAILEGASGVVQTGGRLIYLTCSLEAEENHQQIDRFLEGHPEYERDREDLVIFPADGTDGGYGACLKRVGREG